MFCVKCAKRFYLPIKPRKGFYFSSEVTKKKPKASEVLTGYLKQTHEPPWTSYFVKYKDVIDDQFGRSYFNWQVNDSNYAVLRMGCYPFIKYHCTKAPKRNLDREDKFYTYLKIANFGYPSLLYGLAALLLARHKEFVHLETGDVCIYFLMKENLGSKY